MWITHERLGKEQSYRNDIQPDLFTVTVTEIKHTIFPVLMSIILGCISVKLMTYICQCLNHELSDNLPYITLSYQVSDALNMDH